MPQIDRGPGQRLALSVEHLAFEKHHGGTLFAAIVHPRLAFKHRGPGHIQRAFDGARGAACLAGLLVLGVLQQVDKMFDAQPRHQQPGFRASAQTVEIIHRLPEFILADVEVFDNFGTVLQDPQDDAFQAWVAVVTGKAGGFFEEALDGSGMGNFHGHGAHLILFLCKG